VPNWSMTVNDKLGRMDRK